MQIWLKQLADKSGYYGENTRNMEIMVHTFIWYGSYGQDANGPRGVLSGMDEWLAMFEDVWPDEWPEEEEWKDDGRDKSLKLHQIDAVKKVKVKKKYWKDQKDQSQRLYNCPGLHGLSRFLTPKHGYYCNECVKCFNRGTVFHGCRICDFDLCFRCYKPPNIEHGVSIDYCAGDGGAMDRADRAMSDPRYGKYGRKGSKHKQIYSNSKMMIQMSDNVSVDYV